MRSVLKPCKCKCASKNHVLVRRNQPYFDLPVRLLLLVLLGFIGVAGHAGNFKTTSTNYDDIHQSPFAANQQLEFHTDKLFEQSNFSLPKHVLSTTTGSHHKHLEYRDESHRSNSRDSESQSNSSLQGENYNNNKKKIIKKKPGRQNKTKDPRDEDESREDQIFSGGQDFPEGHEIPGGHDFLQGHRSHHSEPLTMAHRLDDEFKGSTSVPVVPIQLPPPNETIHYHYTDDEDSDFYQFAKISPSYPKSSSSSNSNNTPTMKSSTSSGSSSAAFIKFDTFQEDREESKARGVEEKTGYNDENSLIIRASMTSKSQSRQSQNFKRSSNNLNGHNKAKFPQELETSPSETFPRILYNQQEHLHPRQGSGSKFHTSNPLILYDQSPFNLNHNSQTHEDLDDQPKQQNYYISKRKKGNELSYHNVNDDREFKKTQVQVTKERDDSVDNHDEQDNESSDKHLEKSVDESKHVEEVADFESKKIVAKVRKTKFPPLTKGSLKETSDRDKGNRAIIPSTNTNATSNSLEDLEDDFDYENPEDEGDNSLMRRRPRRSVVHLYDMVVCATGCNPLAYKGYGCYCGFLGSGLTVDGIDRCCAKHDWCYHHAKCPPLLTYFVPYYWTCNAGRPKCVTDYRGWKGVCGANLCECDRQFAECLRKFPCPRSRAMCMTSPWRFWQNLLMTQPMRYSYETYEY